VNILFDLRNKAGNTGILEPLFSRGHAKRRAAGQNTTGPLTLVSTYETNTAIIYNNSRFSYFYLWCWQVEVWKECRQILVRSGVFLKELVVM